MSVNASMHLCATITSRTSPRAGTPALVSATISHVLERPTHRRVLTFFALAGIAAHAFSDVLALRARTLWARFAHVPPRRRRACAGRNARGLPADSFDGVFVHGSALVRQQAASLRGLDTRQARRHRGRTALRSRCAHE